jgi:hypothetical protein
VNPRGGAAGLARACRLPPFCPGLAARRVSNPRIKPRGPANSAAMARKANRFGMRICWVKAPMVPAKPGPPNQPRAFCAPCGKKTTPKKSRSNRGSRRSSVFKRGSSVFMRSGG